MNKLSAAIIYTAQGVPFMLSGEEILRTKPIEGSDEFSHNSYNLNDYTNSIKWDTLDDVKTADMLDYYKGLIAFRSEHPALRMTTTEDIEANLVFMDVEQKNVVAYTIANSPNGEKAKNILVAYNGNEEAVDITLPEGKWNVYINGEKAGTEVLDTVEGTVNVAGISAVVLVQEGTNVALIVGIVIAAVAILAGVYLFANTKKKAKKA